MRDELAKEFLTWFPDVESLRSPEAIASLESLAHEIHVDISAIEARHALVRRVILAKSQTWIGRFADVSAEWTLRQVAQRLTDEGDLLPEVKSKLLADRRAAARQAQREEQQKQRKTGRGGFGGAWRAYLHVECAGQKFTADSLKASAQVFRALPLEERAVFEQLGRMATLAARAGVKKPFRPQPQEGRQALGSLEDVADAGREDELELPLVAHVSVNFADEIRDMRRKQRRETKRAVQSLQQKHEAAEVHEQQLLQHADAAFGNVTTHAAGFRVAAAASSGHAAAALRWRVPCVAMTKARRPLQ